MAANLPPNMGELLFGPLLKVLEAEARRDERAERAKEQQTRFDMQRADQQAWRDEQKRQWDVGRDTEKSRYLDKLDLGAETAADEGRVRTSAAYLNAFRRSGGVPEMQPGPDVAQETYPERDIGPPQEPGQLSFDPQAMTPPAGMWQSNDPFATLEQVLAGAGAPDITDFGGGRPMLSGPQGLGALAPEQPPTQHGQAPGMFDTLMQTLQQAGMAGPGGEAPPEVGQTVSLPPRDRGTEMVPGAPESSTLAFARERREELDAEKKAKVVRGQRKLEALLLKPLSSSLAVQAAREGSEKPTLAQIKAEEKLQREQEKSLARLKRSRAAGRVPRLVPKGKVEDTTKVAANKNDPVKLARVLAGYTEAHMQMSPEELLQDAQDRIDTYRDGRNAKIGSVIDNKRISAIEKTIQKDISALIEAQKKPRSRTNRARIPQLQQAIERKRENQSKLADRLIEREQAAWAGGHTGSAAEPETKTETETETETGTPGKPQPPSMQPDAVIDLRGSAQLEKALRASHVDSWYEPEAGESQPPRDDAKSGKKLRKVLEGWVKRWEARGATTPKLPDGRDLKGAMALPDDQLYQFWERVERTRRPVEHLAPSSLGAISPLLR